MPDSSAPADWLLLLHFLPTSKAQARVQAWRRLQRVGALSLKNSAYALPNSPESREDFEWIRNEVIAAGGQAMVLVAQAPNQATLDDVTDAFRAARADEFNAIAGEARALLKRAAPRQSTNRRALTQRVRRLRERYLEAVRLDFLNVEQRDDAAAVLDQLDQRTGRRPPMAGGAVTGRLEATDYRGRTWTTRPRPGVDRMSSAWLIQRFIDPKAQFAFGDIEGDSKAVPFDTFEAEFGHHGTHCTFETLCERFGIADTSVQRIGRIVHDLDLKEATYSEPEAPTVGRLVEGLRRAHGDDGALLRAGMDMFEALYQSMASEVRRTPHDGASSTKKVQGSSRRRKRQKR